MTKRYEKGTLGWLREQQKIKAKKDGFDNIDDWLKWKAKERIIQDRIIQERITKLRRLVRFKKDKVQTTTKCSYRPQHRHEKIAFPYLQSIGYDISDIKINRPRYGKPDIITCDGKEWEVKMAHSSFLVFSNSQFDNFSDNVQILIYGKYESEGYPLEVISFGDFKKGLCIYHTKIGKHRKIFLRKSGYIIGVCYQEFVYNENQKLIDVKTSYRIA